MVAIVLLPGMDGSGELFEDFAAELKAKSIVIPYPSGQPLGYNDLESLVLAALPKGEPFILLGESFSGPVAIALAARQLPLLRGVVLVCSFSKLPLSLPKFVKRLLIKLPFWRAPISLTAMVLLGRFRTRTIEKKLAIAIDAVSANVWKARLGAVLDVDKTAVLRDVNVPLLYLRASQDRVVFPSAGAHICNVAPQAKLVTIEGPHFLLQAKPRESADVVRKFARYYGLSP